MSTLPSGAIKRYIAGQITANETNEVTLTVNQLEADSVIVYSLNTVGGTPAGAPYTSSKNTTTNTIGMKAASGDTSVYDVLVFV
ncbi:MAG: hypothetical protein Unbinned5081contig1002_52 [Prokaryotic dsDNA virus sp.]|nr:MAG: hypothetical protein Unbinned5081contig1002_52 [Prokaryotic dsDNA virus sp.]|tara:strand:+ start:19537 stop:19788 length:252 start_codon:yes stop_codon:yes gene_type:complete